MKTPRVLSLETRKQIALLERLEARRFAQEKEMEEDIARRMQKLAYCKAERVASRHLRYAIADGIDTSLRANEYREAVRLNRNYRIND